MVECVLQMPASRMDVGDNGVRLAAGNSTRLDTRMRPRSDCNNPLQASASLDVQFAQRACLYDPELDSHSTKPESSRTGRSSSRRCNSSRSLLLDFSVCSLKIYRKLVIV